MCLFVTVCCNPKIVHEIQPYGVQGPLRITTNREDQSFHEVATLNLLPLKVHFNQHSMANILSMSDVANLKGGRLSMDLVIDRAILLHYG